MDLDDTIKKWNEAKEKISLLENKIEKYKKQISERMRKDNTTKLKGTDYTISKRQGTRSYLSKESVPSDIWREYSTKVNYESFYITKNKI